MAFDEVFIQNMYTNNKFSLLKQKRTAASCKASRIFCYKKIPATTNGSRDFKVP